MSEAPTAAVGLFTTNAFAAAPVVLSKGRLASGAARAVVVNSGHTWTAPSVIVANEDFDFNQSTQAYTTPTGRVIVTWHRRRFSDVMPFPETEGAVEIYYRWGRAAVGV